MRLLALASLFAGLLAVAVPAQARKPLLGTVADSRGAPLAGFDVECVLAPEGPAAPAVEILRAKTDARGRFRVDALQCAYYRCWAAGPAMDDGARLVSDEQPIAVGQIVTLTVRARAKAGCSLRGLEAWQERAPFVLRQSVAGQIVEFPVEAVDDGFVARLGPRPSGERMAHLVDRDGFTVFVTSLTTMATHANVPAAQTLRCRVVDADGKPVAGARIVRVGSAARVDDGVSSAKIELAAAYRDPVQAFACGVTGEDGVAVVALAHRSRLLDANADFGDRTFLLRAESPGKAAPYAGRDGDMLFEDGREVEWKEGRDGFVFTLKPVAPVSGRLVDGARPLPGVSMRLSFKTPLVTKAGWSREWVDERHAVTDAEGRFRFEGVPPTANELTLGCAVSGDRPTGDAGTVLAIRPVLPARLGVRADRTQDVVVDLATFRTVALTVRDDTGGPGRVLQLAVAPAHADWGDLNCMTLLAPDATGRVAVLLAPGPWIVAACSQDGFALQEVDAEAKSVELAIAPFPSMRARVVDAEGKPVAGATFKTGGTHWHGGQENGVARMTQWLASEWNQTLLARGKSDDAGVLRLSLLPAPGYAVAGRIVQRERKSAELQAAAEDVGDVVVQ